MTAIDKSKQLNASIKLINNKLHFTGQADTNEPVSIDYTPPFGDNLGYTSLELFLLSFSSCIGSAILVLLRKMGKTVDGFEILSAGIRNEQHPTSFSKIILEIVLTSPDVSASEFEKVTSLSDEKLCPVRAMIKGNVEVVINRKIIA